MTSGAFAITGAGDYVFGATSNSSHEDPQTIAAGGGATVREVIPASSGNATITEELILTAPGTLASTFTYTKNGTSLTMALAFKA